jgi:NAD-dependent SIR2 family protein deacetylase
MRVHSSKPRTIQVVLAPASGCWIVPSLAAHQRHTGVTKPASLACLVRDPEGRRAIPSVARGVVVPALACYGSAVDPVESLVALLRGRRVAVLTGAGCSTESGIPDYRGADTPPRKRPPIQHREFIDRPEMRRRYWARSMLGWPMLSGARPNPAHDALAGLEHAGVVTGLITQNVDGLHQRAGSRAVVELHGALARVRCLGCDALVRRDDVQARLLAANPAWPERARRIESAPDGDADLPDELVADFEVMECEACDGMLMPDVVFFGGSVPRATLDAAWATFERGEVLLVVGSSLTVFSGYRFVRRAAEHGIPVAILNRGTTRGDAHAALRIDARAGEVLVAVRQALT